FATRSFEEGDVIEVCPAIVLPEHDARRLDGTRLYDYYFGWGPDGRQAAIALGYGSLYNHSVTPNAAYRKNTEAEAIAFIATKTILPGEEIHVTYNPGPGNLLWFDAV
ncbi:MAG: SET domain-containing protein-lysine N-methyltransferase, partial [Acetobacteraceae bacterium]|nr:SET domain-containing protein-lysine N-methyltransferase [Acetobacteraceae bacterium]